MKMPKRKKTPFLMRLALMLALLLMMMLLISCAEKQIKLVNTNPTASSEFLECVLKEYKEEIYGRCTKDVVKQFAKKVNE